MATEEVSEQKNVLQFIIGETLSRSTTRYYMWSNSITSIAYLWQNNAQLSMIAVGLSMGISLMLSRHLWVFWCL
jgi:aminopeptidase-like protein